MYADCRLPDQLEHISSHLTNALYTLAETAAIDPAIVTDTVSNKKGGFFGPLASVFEGILKVGLAAHVIKVAHTARDAVSGHQCVRGPFRLRQLAGKAQSSFCLQMLPALTSF